MILSRSSKATKAGVLGSLFVSKLFTPFPRFICYNAITEKLRERAVVLDRRAAEGLREQF